MTISVFDQAITLLKHPDVQRRLRAGDVESAFVVGYMLAQVCPRCGDLMKYERPDEPIEIKATLLPRKRGRT